MHMSQASAATFSSTPQGHPFCLRVPLAKATANRCAGCGLDIRRHSREEVTDEQLLAVLNAQAAHLELSWHPNDLLACSSRDTFVLPRLAHHAAGILRMTAG